MKTLVMIVLFPLVVLAAVTAAIYQLIASIPPWLLVAVIAYLVYRLRRRPAPAPRHHKTNTAPTQLSGPWAHQQVRSLAPTVVYVVAPDSRPQRELPNAPEPWILH